MTELVKKPVTLFSLALILILVPLALRLARLGAPAAAATSAAVSAPASTNVASTMIRAGLGPEAISAVGVTAQQVNGIVAAFQSAFAASPQLLPTADADYAAAKTESDRLRRLIESGQGGASEVTTYQSEMQTLATAIADREAALGSFCAAAGAGLSQIQAGDLATLHGNAGWEVDFEFKIVDRAEQEWVDLRKALENERISAKSGTAPSVSQQALLATLRADPKVAAGKASLEANGASVEAAWTPAATSN